MATHNAAEPLTNIEVQLSERDGNADFIIARVREALRRGGRADLVEPFTTQAKSGDYDNVLSTCRRFVRVL